MRVLIDTNVLISAALNPGNTPDKAYIKATSYPNRGVLCEQNLDELRRIFNKKFPNRIAALERFLANVLSALELIPTPIEESILESKVRDIKDRPILRAALAANVDIIITGDKDLLESGLVKPIMMTPAEFLNMI